MSGPSVRRIGLVVLAWLAILSGCERDRHEPTPSSAGEIATPVERSDEGTSADWCTQHGVPESRCATCLKRSGFVTGSSGACGVSTTTCEESLDPVGSGTALGDGGPGDG